MIRPLRSCGHFDIAKALVQTRSSRRNESLAHRGEKLRLIAFQQCGENCFLPREIMIERANTYSCPFRYCVGIESSEPTLFKNLSSRFQDRGDRARRTL